MDSLRKLSDEELDAEHVRLGLEREAADAPLRAAMEDIKAEQNRRAASAVAEAAAVDNGKGPDA